MESWFSSTPADSCSKVYTPKQALWRRAGAIRLSARNSDFLVICLYFPPRTNQGAHAQARYCSTVQELVNWTEQVVEDAPHRTLPTIGLDLNDGLGRWKGRQIESEALSAGCIREEGFAGKLFREMMERQRLYAASGHFRALPTFHGTQGNTSTIDFVVLPQSYAESIRAATVLAKSGRQLQHARVRPLDHDPVMIRFEYAPDFFRPAKRERPTSRHGSPRAFHDHRLPGELNSWQRWNEKQRKLRGSSRHTPR